MNSGRLVVAMMLATIMGILAAFWAYLVVGYEIGVVSGLGTGGYNLLQSWLYHPTDTDIPGIVFTGFGFCFTRRWNIYKRLSAASASSGGCEHDFPSQDNSSADN